MSDTTFKFPTSMTTQSVAPESNNDWSAPTNIGADDALYASITAPTFDSPDISYRLKAQGFDFSSIPDASTIDGIVVELEGYNDAGETVKDYRIQLLDDTGALIGNNKAVAGNWATTPTRRTYGGETDTWGATLTTAIVKDADFGVVLSVQATAANADVYVDYIRIIILYSNGNPEETFYPDAHTETTSVDGNVGATITQNTWATLVAANGTTSGDAGTGDDAIFIFITSGDASNTWKTLYRSITLFDTSGLPDDASISAATYSLYGDTVYQPEYFSLSMNVYSAVPASDVALVNADFNVANWGSTAYCDTPIAIANWLDETESPYWNNFALNATGIAAISKTGITKMGVRDTRDASDTPPTWTSFVSSYMTGFSAEKGNGYKPKLVVTYTVGAAYIPKVIFF